MTLKAHKLKKSYRDKGLEVVAVRDVYFRDCPRRSASFLGSQWRRQNNRDQMIAGLIRPDAGWVKLKNLTPTLTLSRFGCWGLF